MTDILDYREERDFDDIIASCEKEGWRDFFAVRREEFRRALSSSHTLVAFSGGKYCGFARYITDGSFTVYCCEIIVDRPFRRKGIGRLLLEKAAAEYPSCAVDVLSDNDDFYISSGFRRMCSGMRRPAPKGMN